MSVSKEQVERAIASGRLKTPFFRSFLYVCIGYDNKGKPNLDETLSIDLGIEALRYGAGKAARETHGTVSFSVAQFDKDDSALAFSRHMAEVAPSLAVVGPF